MGTPNNASAENHTASSTGTGGACEPMFAVECARSGAMPGAIGCVDKLCDLAVATYNEVQSHARLVVAKARNATVEAGPAVRHMDDDELRLGGAAIEVRGRSPIG